MVYQEKFVAVIKCNNEILREKNGVVYLPFGSEYSIRLKNLNSRNAVVNVSIDGQDVLNGSRLFVTANSSTELEGVLSGDVVKNRFKFIQKTDEIKEVRGDRIDDGIVRIEYRFEKPKPEIFFQRPLLDSTYYDLRTSSTPHGGIYSRSLSAVETDQNNAYRSTTSVNSDEGITVKGSPTNQEYNSVFAGALESESFVITLNIKGVFPKQEIVRNPILVREKIQCPTCNRYAKSSNSYCPNCGTCLI